MSTPAVRYVGGACISGERELRITRRCLTEDLGRPLGTTFNDLRGHEIIRAFENERSADPRGTKTVGPAAGDRTVYRLAYGHRHRGATWFDEEHQVVWLCAYGYHESGGPDDAFPYFQDLIANRRILPTVDDYEDLLSERGRRFVSTVAEDAQLLLSDARSNPGIEKRGLLGGEEPTGVVVDLVETLEETYVAFSVANMIPTRVIIILAAFFPDADFADWELVDTLPTRAVRGNDGEVGYRILHGSI